MLVSICIPTYSRLNYLKKAVSSAKSQTYFDVEICILQNPKETGADEDIRQWCESQRDENTIRYSLNKRNLGLSGNLNALAKFAKGEYLVFLGDDDLLHENFVKELMEKIEYKVGVGFTSQFFIDKDGKLLETETLHLNHFYKRDILHEGIIDNPIFTVFNNSIPLSASIIKKELAMRYPFNEELNTPEFPFFLKIALDKTEKFFYLNKQLAYYRLHQNSETSKGLTTEKLLKDVLSISVPNKYQHLKDAFISDKIIPSINKALLSGDKKLANSFLKSAYYPKRKLVKAIQKLLLLLPTSLTMLVFKLRKI